MKNFVPWKVGFLNVVVLWPSPHRSPPCSNSTFQTQQNLNSWAKHALLLSDLWSKGEMASSSSLSSITKRRGIPAAKFVEDVHSSSKKGFSSFNQLTFFFSSFHLISDVSDFDFHSLMLTIFHLTLYSDAGFSKWYNDREFICIYEFLYNLLKVWYSSCLIW